MCTERCARNHWPPNDFFQQHSVTITYKAAEIDVYRPHSIAQCLCWSYFSFEIAINASSIQTFNHPSARDQSNIFHTRLINNCNLAWFVLSVTLSGHVHRAFFPSRHTLLVWALDDLNRERTVQWNWKRDHRLKHAY